MSPTLKLLSGLFALLTLTTATPIESPGFTKDVPLGPHFHLRVDPTHPNSAIRSYGHLTSLPNLVRGFNAPENLIFDNVPSSSIPFEAHLPIDRPSSEKPPRFVGAFTDTWWGSFNTSDSDARGPSIVDANQVPGYRQLAREHLRLRPGILMNENRTREWDQWYYPKQKELDFSERNQFYRLYANSGEDNKGDYYGCGNVYSPPGGCWLQTGFTVAEAKERHWLGYAGRWENMWSLCKGVYHNSDAIYYELRLVDAKKAENCSEPFSLEVEYIKDSE